ncbi:AI-2E family transporter [Mucilaginibacter koreensis]
MADFDTKTNVKDEYSYVQKVWIAIASVTLLTILIFILKAAFGVLLMVLAGTLIATYFHGLGDIIQRHTKTKRSVAMAGSVIITISIIALLVWFLGTKISAQASTISRDIPALVEKAENQLRSTDIGNKIMDNFSGTDSQKKLYTTAQNFFSTSFGVVGDLYIIIFMGIFFSVSPSLYKDGVIMLIPKKARPDAICILDRITHTLKAWLKGMMLAMLIIATLSCIGLTIIGVPMGLALAVFAGLLNFIPNFGPVIAMAPAVLIALTMSFNTALTVAILYILIQTLESNIITPTIQKRMINIPPAVSLIGQLIMGSVSGALGIILAVPLIAILMIIIDELYVKKQKDDSPIITQ